jgi:hypothetical protein
MNPNDTIQKLEERIAHLEQIVNIVFRPDFYIFERPIQGGTKGLKLGRTKDKIAFLGSTPIVQWTSGIGRQDIFDGGGGASKVGTQWDGNTGTTYYSVGDVVAALKTYGLLAP